MNETLHCRGQDGDFIRQLSVSLQERHDPPHSQRDEEADLGGPTLESYWLGNNAVSHEYGGGPLTGEGLCRSATKGSKPRRKAYTVRPETVSHAKLFSQILRVTTHCAARVGGERIRIVSSVSACMQYTGGSGGN